MIHLSAAAPLRLSVSLYYSASASSVFPFKPLIVVIYIIKTVEILVALFVIGVIGINIVFVIVGITVAPAARAS